MFREPCSPLHQNEEQPDIPLRNVGIPRMNLDTEKTREKHNLYIERIRRSLKKSLQDILHYSDTH